MGIMNLPSELKFTEENVVEVYTQGQKIVKYLLRISYDSKKDICFIIEPEENKVITNWFNMKADRHMTLNREKYQLK
jgi:hypothetical protein